MRGNQAPYINKDLEKTIYTRTRLKNIGENRLEKISQRTKNKEIYVCQ